MKKILLMEDHPAHAMDLIQQMETLGYEAAWARNAAEALEMLGKDEFDIVIADILVREGYALAANGGVTLIGKVRGAAMKATVGNVTRRLPIIAISGAFDADGQPNFLSKTALGLGADAALPKPVDMEKLGGLVASLTTGMS